MRLITVLDDEPICGNCNFFHLHYVSEGRGYIPIYNGHYVYPRMKIRKVFDTCPYFKKRSDKK